jgi:hypothetical protein
MAPRTALMRTTPHSVVSRVDRARKDVCKAIYPCAKMTPCRNLFDTVKLLEPRKLSASTLNENFCDWNITQLRELADFLV